MGCTESKTASAVLISDKNAGPSGPSSPNKTTSPSLQLPSSPSPTHNTVQNHETSSGGSRDRLGSSVSDDGSDASSGYRRAERLLNNTNTNPKSLTHSTSKIGLDELIEDRRADGNLRENVVHLEVPFGKPIEEVYDGVHTGPVLGSGISGTVRLVTHKATGIKYAVKVLDLGLVDNGEGLRQLREEIFIMCQLDHPNIVRLEEVYESVSEIYLVQELCLGGELFDRLDEQPDYHYTEAECARLVKQMLCAVRYLHSKGIIHRDLKLENFLFSSTSKDSELKMIDFGLSKHFRYGEVQHEAVGTPYTVAPEVIRGSYDERCDVWAIGVIAFLLLSGDPPFGGCGGPEPLMLVRSNILKGYFRFEPEDVWANVSSLAKEFIKLLLKVDPKDRPTAQTAQQHPWVVEWASISRKGKDNRLNPNVVRALVNFKEFSDMRKLLCEVLSFTLLPYQIKELRREFEKMDTEGSGEISLSALKQVLLSNAGAGSLGALTEEEVEDIFNAMRVKKTETKIHWHEFIAAGLSQCQVDDRNLRLAFERLDSDHKGYIILDDIMDLMGSDAITSEDDMERMWGDGVKSLKGQHARITYDDFLLLMKGQTMETHAEETPEAIAAEEEGKAEEEKKDVALVNDITPAPKSPTKEYLSIANAIEHFDSPLSMDDEDETEDDDHVVASGPGVPGTAASLTPPASPMRGTDLYATPGAQRRAFCELKDAAGLELPGLTKPPPYTRRRSRSLDEQDAVPKKDKPAAAAKDDDNRLSAVAEVVRDMILPETDHHSLRPCNNEIADAIHDESKTALVVNRKLYRAHRQMRLAVLEASKRFEEQQAEHAKQVISAAREASERHRVVQAGLVMRHGHKKQVSTKSIRALLERNREQQNSLVEKANRSSGRGRRSKKKTVSDMSSMLTNLNPEDLLLGAPKTGASAVDLSIPEDSSMQMVAEAEPVVLPATMEEEDMILEHEGHERGATVPGEFRTTTDPFAGRYYDLNQSAPSNMTDQAWLC